MLFLLTVCSLVLNFVKNINSVPSDVCFAKFRWEDCGKPPTPVMYYWKSGSRCEVGIWRGCLPSHNMFKDEYECVSTCIFAPRAKPEDYHNYNDLEYDNKDRKDDDDDINTTVQTNETEEITTTKDGEGEDGAATEDPDGAGDTTGAEGEGDAAAEGEDAATPAAEGGDAAEGGGENAEEAAPAAEGENAEEAPAAEE